MTKALFSVGFPILLLATTYAFGNDVKKPAVGGSGLKMSDPPMISSLLKAPLLKRVLEDKEIILYASMLVSASVKEAYTALTDYKLYARLVPFIESAVFSPITHTLLLEGGIWNFRLASQILFAERPDRWIHFDIISGHFAGLSGNIYFESQGEKGTLIYLSGEQVGTHWPPTFVIERGAEIVFGFTAHRMRSYIESTKKAQHGGKHGEEERQIPEPRNRL
jgi:hypothetical protein